MWIFCLFWIFFCIKIIIALITGFFAPHPPYILTESVVFKSPGLSDWLAVFPWGSQSMSRPWYFHHVTEHLVTWVNTEAQGGNLTSTASPSSTWVWKRLKAWAMTNTLQVNVVVEHVWDLFSTETEGLSLLRREGSCLLLPLSSQSTLFSLNDSSDCSCSHVCLSRLCFSLCVDAVSSQHPAQCWPWTCSVSVCRVKASIGCFCICIIVLQFAGHPPDGYGIWFYHDCAPPTVSLQLLCLWTCGTSFWWVPVFSYWRLFNS